VTLSHLRSRLVLLLVVPVLLLAAACSGTVSSKDADRATIAGLEVSGTVGTAPGVRLAAPLAVPKVRSQVAFAGTGAPVQIDQLFVLQLTMYDARTGAKVLSTYDGTVPPVVAKSSDDTLFPALVTAVVGQRQGSRVVLALPAADAYGAGGTPPAGLRPDDPVVVIADIVAVPPTSTLASAAGKTESPVDGSPQVTLAEGDPIGIAFSGATEPAGVQVITLITGDGPKVRDHSLVTLHFLGQAWGARAPYADTYFKEPAVVPVGAEGSVPSWDQALVGLHQGSRVLVIGPAGPPSVATGPGIGEDDPIAWVVDVLGVS
jgi:peptidylprolyl isomerase